MLLHLQYLDVLVGGGGGAHDSEVFDAVQDGGLDLRGHVGRNGCRIRGARDEHAWRRCLDEDNSLQEGLGDADGAVSMLARFRWFGDCSRSKSRPCFVGESKV